uniref:Uncharacterized protein n=1 Tax=Thermorudis peleae TaxID=1382356 RepID=A0A831X902_9BACT
MFVEPALPSGAVVHDEDLILYRALDQNEEPTGPITGIEVIGFLEFDRWEDLPQLDLLWQLPGQEPLPLDELLKRLQRELRQQAKQIVSPA